MPAFFCLILPHGATRLWRTETPHALSWAGVSLRRSLLRWMALAAVVLATLPGAQAQPGYTVSLQNLQREVAQRFPLRYPIAGLLDVNVQAPQLRLLPEQNRVSATMAVEASGEALRRSHLGTFDVDFALRYEPSDRTIRAYRLNFQNLQIPDLQAPALALLNAYGPAMANAALQEVVLHQLRPKDLAIVDGMGMQPGSITVTAQGLVIGFVLKPL
jgi:hypothetical protein